jgi:hypothetical protein
MGSLSLPPAKTIIVALHTSSTADTCCSGVATMWDPAGGPGGASTNGIAVKQSGSDVVAVLDYAGENDQGATPLANTPHILSLAYNDTGGAAVLWVDGCSEIVCSPGAYAHMSTKIAVGFRASDPTGGGGNRHLEGSVAEVLIFNRSLGDDERSQWEAVLIARYGIKVRTCPSNSIEFVEGTFDATNPTPLYIITNASRGSAQNPQPSWPSAAQTYAAAIKRTSKLAARVLSSTPSPFLDGALGATAAAIDGLYRSAPTVYLHGAMAWDVPLVGWRSEYGATCWGWTENVAAEGRYFFANQVTDSNQTQCFADEGRKLTQAAKGIEQCTLQACFVVQDPIVFLHRVTNN